jgi:DNA-directed RNA polymerase subunit omega
MAFSAQTENLDGGSQTIMSTAKEGIDKIGEDAQSQELDSKYRLIIVAAKRSKQLQRGAKPRIDIDAQKHKPTRIALEEVIQGKVPFEIKAEDGRLTDL